MNKKTTSYELKNKSALEENSIAKETTVLLTLIQSEKTQRKPNNQ
jgi:hypothetical protein